MKTDAEMYEELAAASAKLRLYHRVLVGVSLLQSVVMILLVFK